MESQKRRASEVNDSFQTVHTMDDYYDGPRSGVADFDGQPHYYRAVYWDTPQWDPDDDRFELSPITTDVLAAACEMAAIFERWDTTRKATPNFSYTDEEFGALPEDRTRYRQLERFLESSYAAAAQARRILVHGEFRVCKSLPSRLQVRWRLAISDRAA
jgi:hypothetical protein